MSSPRLTCASRRQASACTVGPFWLDLGDPHRPHSTVQNGDRVVVSGPAWPRRNPKAAAGTRDQQVARIAGQLGELERQIDALPQRRAAAAARAPTVGVDYAPMPAFAHAIEPTVHTPAPAGPALRLHNVAASGSDADFPELPAFAYGHERAGGDRDYAPIPPGLWDNDHEQARNRSCR